MSKFESPRRSVVKKAALFAWATLQSIPEETVRILNHPYFTYVIKNHIYFLITVFLFGSITILLLGRIFNFFGCPMSLKIILSFPIFLFSLQIFEL